MVLYIVIPLAAGWATRVTLIRRRGIEWLDRIFMRRIAPVTPVGLIITLVLLFAFQGEVILADPLHIGLIAVPLVVQTVVGVLVEVPLMLALVRYANRARDRFPAASPPPTTTGT